MNTYIVTVTLGSYEEEVLASSPDEAIALACDRLEGRAGILIMDGVWEARNVDE